METKKALYKDDLMTGLLAGLVFNGMDYIDFTDITFHQAMEQLYNRIKMECNRYEVKLGFIIKCHPIHGDSLVLIDLLNAAFNRDLLTMGNLGHRNTFILKINIKDDAINYLTGLIFTAEFYIRWAKELIEIIRELKERA